MNYLSILKLHPAAPLASVNDKLLLLTLLGVCDYLAMLALKLIC